MSSDNYGWIKIGNEYGLYHHHSFVLGGVRLDGIVAVVKWLFPGYYKITSYYPQHNVSKIYAKTIDEAKAVALTKQKLKGFPAV